jgi:hypothetical protein
MVVANTRGLFDMETITPVKSVIVQASRHCMEACTRRPVKLILNYSSKSVYNIWP